MIRFFLEFSWKYGGDADIVMFPGRILYQAENDFRVKLFIGYDAVSHQSGSGQQI
ncbi:unknown [Clostridium sp. CAG:299]|nr:unknown [Clostridium sp. CAG:299]